MKKQGPLILALLAAAGLFYYFWKKRPAPEQKSGGSGGSGSGPVSVGFVPTTDRTAGTPAGAPVPSLTNTLAASGVSLLQQLLGKLLGGSGSSSGLSAGSGGGGGGRPGSTGGSGGRPWEPLHNPGNSAIRGPSDPGIYTDPATGRQYDLATGYPLDPEMGPGSPGYGNYSQGDMGTLTDFGGQFDTVNPGNDFGGNSYWSGYNDFGGELGVTDYGGSFDTVNAGNDFGGDWTGYNDFGGEMGG
jgi:hypothetical protein